MRITSVVECSARVLVRLAGLPAGQALSAEKLSELENISRDYVDQILQKLRRAGVVASHRGSQGGYSLARAACEITIGAMVRAVDGEILEDVCGKYSEGANECSHHAAGCGVRPIWRRLTELVSDYLDHITVAQLLSEESEVAAALSTVPVKFVDFGRGHGIGKGESRAGPGKDPAVHPIRRG